MSVRRGLERMLAEHPTKMKCVISVASELAAPYRVIDGKKFRLKDIDPRGTGSSRRKRRASADATIL